MASQVCFTPHGDHLFLSLSIMGIQISLYSLAIYSFEYRLRVALGPAGDLSLTSRIRNTNSDGRPSTENVALLSGHDGEV